MTKARAKGLFPKPHRRSPPLKEKRKDVLPPSANDWAQSPSYTIYGELLEIYVKSKARGIEVKNLRIALKVLSEIYPNDSLAYEINAGIVLPPMDEEQH